MPGRFEVHEDAQGRFRYRLLDADRLVVASGGPCPSKADAKRVCEAVFPAAEGAEISEVES